MNQHSSPYSDNNNNSETFPPANLLTNNSVPSTPQSVSNKPKSKGEKWIIMYTNIRGLKGKTPSLAAILHEHQPQLFLLTETLLKSDTGLKIKGYTMYSRARKSGAGGGVAILVRNDVLKHVAPHISDRDTEIIWVSAG